MIQGQKMNFLEGSSTKNELSRRFKDENELLGRFKDENGLSSENNNHHEVSYKYKVLYHKFSRGI